MRRLFQIIVTLLCTLCMITVAYADYKDDGFSNGSDVFHLQETEYYINVDDADYLYSHNLSNNDQKRVLSVHVISIFDAGDTAYLLVYENGMSYLSHISFDDFEEKRVLDFDTTVTVACLRDSCFYYIENGILMTYNIQTGVNTSLVEDSNVELCYFVNHETMRYYKFSEDGFEECIYNFENSEPEASLMETISYIPRLVEPDINNPYYTSWNIFDKCGYGMVRDGQKLGNCTCYAYGRTYENLQVEPNLCTGNAGTWYSYNINNGFYQYGLTPALGAVVVWDRPGYEGHVGVVEVIDDNYVTTSESGWNSFYFRTRVRDKNDTAHLGLGSSYNLLGYIYVLGDFGGYSGGHTHSVIRQGSSGQCVYELQEALNLLIGAGLNVDGNFGTATKTKLIDYQKSRGLEGDGICGSASWGKINNEMRISRQWIRVNKSTVSPGENITFTYAADYSGGYKIEIDKVGDGRKVTEDVPVSGFTTKFSDSGQYSAFVTCYNNNLRYWTFDQVDTDRVYFTVKSQNCTLDLNGLLDGSEVGNLGDYGTADVEINGTNYADDVNYYHKTHPHGTTYAIKDVKPKDGFSYNGVHRGTRTGTINGNDVEVCLDFSRISTSGIEQSGETIYNGHRYVYYSTEVTWYTAKQFCEEQGGHLVTISDRDENIAVLNISDNKQVWMGGTDIGREGLWKWVNGDPIGFTAWGNGEPNNAEDNDEGDENYLHLWADGTWNDACGCSKRGFVCEFDEIENKTLNIKGYLDGSDNTSLGVYGTVDIYINGSLVADDVIEFDYDYPIGTSYEIQDIKPKAGYSYNGIRSGSRIGQIEGSDVDVRIEFSKISTSDIEKAGETTYNGNRYVYYSTEVTWYTAKQYCEEKGGHLVTISDMDENLAVLSISDSNQSWIGGTDVGIEGLWRWVTGDSIGFTAWGDGEPNNVVENDEGNENYLLLCADGTWNDLCGCSKRGFICEFDRESDRKIVLGSQTVAFGSTFDVSVRMENNPGIVSFDLQIDYDADKLELVHSSEGDFANVAFGTDVSVRPYPMAWTGGTSANNGTTAGILTFKVKDGVSNGSTLITVSYGAEPPCDISDHEVDFRLTNGTINIRGFIPGDANGDGNVTARDATRILQHVAKWDVVISSEAADVNGDGKVTARDATRILQYVAKWDVKLECGAAELQSISSSNEAMLFALDQKILIENQTISPGEEFIVPVKIEGNPGIASFELLIDYDADKLELVNSTDGDFQNVIFGENVNVKPYPMARTGGTSDSRGCIAGILTFRAKNGISESTQISVSYGEEPPFNITDQEVMFDLINGNIAIEIGPSSGTMGSSQEVMWTYAVGRRSVSVTGIISADNPVYVTTYDTKGQMLSMDVITASGMEIKASDKANTFALFLLDGNLVPKCGKTVIRII